MSLTFFEQRRRLFARQREIEESNTDNAVNSVTDVNEETVTEDKTTEDSKSKKIAKGKE
jgi:hypothetical protein|nr:MAG TPA: hypothetical protein [Caudoviricetes sp.]DAY25781.1 MAG TPA: hypothetical protein [Caudoviricetes sp.]